MNAKILIEKYGFKHLSGEAVERPIDDVYACDLLSWVMAKGKNNTAWITVQTHNNILAVASLLDFACVIVPEGIELEAEVIAKAQSEDVVILSTPLEAYEIFKILYEEGVKK